MTWIEARVEFAQLRAEANLVQCTLCLQPPGEICLNLGTGEPLKHQPAHLVRMLAYEKM